jgi:hypothetical protein
MSHINRYDRALAACVKTLEIGEDTQSLIDLANTDLYEGPCCDFASVCRSIRDDLEGVVPSVLYWDDDAGYSSDVAPIDEDICGGDWYEFSRQELFRFICGRELATYIRR